MLPTLKTMDMEFHSPRAALDYLEGRVLQRFTVPVHDLQVDKRGRITHVGPAPIESLYQVPLADVALGHLDALVGIPAGYAARIEPELHEHSLNELLKRQVAAVTVVVESDKREPEGWHVSAVLPGARFGIDNAVVLNRIESRGLSACVCMRSGQMEVRFGEAVTVEVLPADDVQVTGVLHNAHWGLTKVTTRPILEVGVYLLRLICANGAYARRVLAEGKLMAWATRQQIELFLDRQIDRVLAFSGTVLKAAVEPMSDTIPEEAERETMTRLIARFVGTKRAEELLGDAVSWWEHFNAVTAAANQIGNVGGKRPVSAENIRDFWGMSRNEENSCQGIEGISRHIAEFY